MRRKIPTFVHETNAIPGKANKLNARMVDAVLLGFEECAAHFPSARCEITGTPIRRSLVTPVAKEEALTAFGLQLGTPVLLVMGGSQGAHSLNEAIIKALPLLKDLPLQIIHLTGPQDEQVMTANYRREGIRAHVAAFCHQMELAYGAADIAIARSGAASLTELSHFGLASILIPYPHAAEDHQTRNAEIYVRHQAAVLMAQDETSGESLAKQLRNILENPDRLAKMGRKAQELAPQNAAERVADVIEKLCTK
jgi:UDP-N-acetylglucosamine--N-acetylmuramyl-(pentapeptide) pyrophosphoryl-undecaprenol N-acetylglucosamine transferase